MRKQLRRRREVNRNEEQHAGLLPDATVPERYDISLLVGEGPVQNAKNRSQKPEKKAKPKKYSKNPQKSTNQTKKLIPIINYSIPSCHNQ